MNNNEIQFKIIEKVGVIQELTTGWTKELNIVSWNDAPAKYDIRDWDSEHERMSRGITLTEDQMNKVTRFVTDRNKAKGQEFARNNCRKNNEYER